jgi:DNA-binding NtrC family response regulator
VDVRIMSATNKDLKEEVRQNRFREDLYYRLNVIPIHLPPLRHRKGDIPLLVHHFLMQAVKRYNQPMPVVSPEAMALMINYHWPGNVRELQNTVQFAFVQSKNGKITASSLPIELHRKTLAPDMPIGGKNRKLTVEATTQALISTRWNKVKAAQVLGVGRATLYRFLEEHPEIRIENAACPKTDVSSFER